MKASLKELVLINCLIVDHIHCMPTDSRTYNGDYLVAIALQVMVHIAKFAPGSSLDTHSNNL